MIANLGLAPQGSPAEHDLDSSKRPRRSERLQVVDEHGNKKTPIDTKQQLPSPVTHLSVEESSTRFKEGTATPPEGRPSQVLPRGEEAYSQLQNFSQGFSSPPQDTQAFSQVAVDLNEPYSKDVKDETKEGVWGYLFPLNTAYGGKCVVMKQRAACPLPDTVEDIVPKKKKGKKTLVEEEQDFDKKKVSGVPSGGYLIGRHPECGRSPIRHQKISRPLILTCLSRHRCRRPECFQPPLLDIHGTQGKRYSSHRRGSVKQRHVRERGHHWEESTQRAEGER